MSHNVRRIGCAVVLALVVASAAQALPLHAANTAGGSERGILAAVWDWMASWTSPAAWRAVWEAEGCQIDPNGKPCVSGAGARGTSVEKVGALQRGRN